VGWWTPPPAPLVAHGDRCGVEGPEAGERCWQTPCWQLGVTLAVEKAWHPPILHLFERQENFIKVAQ